jgi:hypothetical protein
VIEPVKECRDRQRPVSAEPEFAAPSEGLLRGRPPPEFKALKKYRPQDWNTLDVTVKGNTAVCLCNGELMQPQPALRLPADGHVGLEADRGQMDYRRIRFKEIP